MSLIIPVYNQAEYLADAIESALDQRVPFREIIVVDDGSTDNSGKIADSYSPKVKVIHQVNKGLSAARNTGIMNSRTRYVGFLDADDLLLPNFNERIGKLIEQTDADIIAPSFKTFGLGSRVVTLDEKLAVRDFITANRIGYCAVVKKSVLQEVGGYSPRMTWGYEDYHLWFDILKRGKTLVTVPEVLWLYRIKEQSMITTAQQHHEELMNQIKKDHHEVFA